MPETKQAVVIASDHAGFQLKVELKQQLEALGFEALDLGTDSVGSVDYPDFADRLAAAIKEGRASKGVLVCGTGIGISMAANRHRHLRAAVVHDATTARLTRQHNDANVLCMGARITGADVAKDCLRVFLTTDFEGGRHENRVAKLGR
ncbi:ribose 5-phosphate isomerase B [Dongia deserti]|uniref:ribose 5-phosphate isomerase B n=1 Tax=Dongia deserti TaxID=2268030 RepID=UPI000E64D27C|nr:ribose 5-phosphate isomerase B [Dongia deserti]